MKVNKNFKFDPAFGKSQPTLLSPQVYCTDCSVPVLDFKNIKSENGEIVGDKLAVCTCGKKYIVKAEDFKHMKNTRYMYDFELYRLVD